MARYLVTGVILIAKIIKPVEYPRVFLNWFNQDFYVENVKRNKQAYLM